MAVDENQHSVHTIVNEIRTTVREIKESVTAKPDGKAMPEMSLDEIANGIKASILWEREYDEEMEMAERMRTANLPPLPDGMPDEVREQIGEWFKATKSRMKDRENQLRTLVPERQEAATELRMKLIMMKRVGMDRLADQF